MSVNPEKTLILDFLPGKLLPQVNLADFPKAFVLDTWLYKTDRRQAIFVGDQNPASVLKFRAYLIDHGMSFDGNQWELANAPTFDRCSLSRMYSMIQVQAVYEEVLPRIEAINNTALCAAAEGVPSAWFSPGDYECLANLFVRLQRRQSDLRSLVSRHLEMVIDSPAPTRACEEGGSSHG
jgi:hypothetical protein